MRRYGFDDAPHTTLSQSAQSLLYEIRTREYSCLIGPNNSGKSYLLKQLTLQMEGNGVYLGPSRYNNFNSLAPYSPRPKRKSEDWLRFSNTLRTAKQNIDSSPFNIQQAVAELDNERRERLFEICGSVLGADLSLELASPNNEMSQRYISCNGHNFSFASSGVRLSVSIVTSLLNTDYSHFFVDEPELGISPEAQGLLANFLLNVENRRRYFPHLRSLVMASHSTLFLDTASIDNNYIVTKTGDAIDVRRLESLAEFNRVHFLLLGNRLENLFLPSYIVIVEGKTDAAFIRRSLELRFPDMTFSVIAAGSDSRMRDYAHMVSEIFPNLGRTPYQDRIIPVLDSIHGGGIGEALERKGIPKENIVVWSCNGIEYYYPPKILARIAGRSVQVEITGDRVSVADQIFTKEQLCERVVGMLREDTEHHSEVEEKLFSKVVSGQ